MQFQRIDRFVGILVLFLSISMMGSIIVTFAFHDGATVLLIVVLVMIFGVGFIICGVTKREATV